MAQRNQWFQASLQHVMEAGEPYQMRLDTHPVEPVVTHGIPLSQQPS